MSKKKRKISGPIIIIFVGAVTSAVGIFLLSARIELLSAIIFAGAVISASGAIWASITNTSFEQELRNKNEEIASFVTGGDSFCYIRAWVDQVSDRQMLELWHEGKYPVFDINIFIDDRTNISKLPFKELFEEIKKSHEEDKAEGIPKRRDLYNEVERLRQSGELRVERRSLSPNTMSGIGRFPYPKEDEQLYFIRIMTRNGYFTQNIKLKRLKDNYWGHSMRVLKHLPDGEKIVLKEEINSNIPLEKDF